MPEMAQLRAMLDHNMVSEWMAEAYLYGMEEWVEHWRDFPNLLHRPPQAEEQWRYASGRPEIELGTLVEAPDLRFGIDLSGGQHCGFIGQTDSGKTVALRNVILNIHRWNQLHPESFVSLIVIDPKGGDYSDIPSLLGDCCLHLSVHDGLRIGINGPRNIPAHVWINFFSTMIFAPRAGLKASEVCVANMIKCILPVLNPQPGQDLDWPSFSVLLETAKYVPLHLFASKIDYERAWMQKAEQVAGEDLFDTANGLDLQRDVIDLKRHAVIDTCGLEPPWVRMLVTDVLLGQLLVARQYAFRKTRRIDTVVLVDESDTEVDHRSEQSFPAGGMMTIARFQKQAREAGCALLLALSALGPVSRQVVTNMNNLFIFRVTDAMSLREARDYLILPEGSEAMLPALERGQSLLRTNNGWPHAVLGQFDNIPTSHRPRPKSFDRLAFAPARHLTELPALCEHLDKLAAQHRSAQRRQSSKTKLPDNARKLLDLAAMYPYTPVPRLWDNVGPISAGAQGAARKALEKRNLAVFAKVRVSKHDVLLIELTEAGFALLGKDPPGGSGRGSLPHRAFQHWLEQVGRNRGYKTACEWLVPPLRSHPVDCAWFVGEGVWIFEIALHAVDNLGSHMRACFEDSDVVSRATIITPSKKLMQQSQDSIAQDLSLMRFADRISFESVAPYMKELWK